MRGQLRRHQEEGGRSWSNSEFRSGYSGTPTHPSIHPTIHPFLGCAKRAAASALVAFLPPFFGPFLSGSPPSSSAAAAAANVNVVNMRSPFIRVRIRPSSIARVPSLRRFPLLPPPCCLRLVPRRVRPSRHPAPALGHRAGVGFTNGETSHSRARMACVECCGRTQK